MGFDVGNEFGNSLGWNGWVHRYQKGPLDDRNGCDVADEIESEVVIEGRVDRGSSIRTKERIAIGGRTDDGLGGDIAGGAAPVLDDEWLTEPLRERLTHQAYEDVCSAARGISNDAAHWPRRIGLRPRDPRHRRQRGSARCEMQKLSAGKFHFELPSPFHIIRPSKAA